MRATKVGVIVAVHNAESTIEETIASAMRQEIPDHLIDDAIQVLPCHETTSGRSGPAAEDPSDSNVSASAVQDDSLSCCGREIQLEVCVCCYNDASTDRSLEILESLETDRTWVKQCTSGDSRVTATLRTTLVVGTAAPGTSSRGAAHARNQAVQLLGRDGDRTDFLCILDSDDVMHPSRIAEQTCAMLALENKEERRRTLMGCQFDRIPKDSTQHYTKWANSLSDERLYLEQFRECTLVRTSHVDACH